MWMKLLSGIIQTKLLSADYYALQVDSKFLVFAGWNPKVCQSKWEQLSNNFVLVFTLFKVVLPLETKVLFWLKRNRNKASLNRIRNSSAGVLCNCERAKVQSNRYSKNKTMQFFLTYLSGVRLENWVKREHLGGCHTHFSVRLWHVTYSARIV